MGVLVCVCTGEMSRREDGGASAVCGEFLVCGLCLENQESGLEKRAPGWGRQGREGGLASRFQCSEYSDIKSDWAQVRCY